MDALSFEKLPHYHFSSNRQFAPGELHINRVYELSVLLLVRKGVLRFSENGVPIEVKEGEYYIQKPNLPQQGITPSDAPNYYFIHFKGHYSKAGALPIRGKFNIAVIQNCIDRIEQLDISAERIEYENAFYALLIALKNGVIQITGAEAIRKYLLDNYANAIDLNIISKNVLLSKNQVINTFRDRYNITPYQFLLNFRLQKASELLLATNKPVEEICYCSGFSEYTAFFKAFKKKYDMSPKEYRSRRSAIPESLSKIPSQK